MELVIIKDFVPGEIAVFKGRPVRVIKNLKGWVTALDPKGETVKLRSGQIVDRPTPEQAAQFDDYVPAAPAYEQGSCPMCRSTVITHGEILHKKNGTQKVINLHLARCQDCLTRFVYEDGSMEFNEDLPPPPNLKTPTQSLREARLKYKSNGSRGRNCGDALADRLYFMSLDDIYDAAAKILRVPIAQLYEQYTHLNVGMQRMCLGNRIRKHPTTADFFGIVQ